ncbi:MAG TPA: hypothetical protein VFI47_24440 [Acidimicrobiales bacterium]|nr:hypothetical protein [Acidimicrobiales bacterium]
MGVRIPMSVEQLGRSRFAISAAMEVVATLQERAASRRAPHVRRRWARARQRMDPDQLGLVCALVPVDHPYVPDFLTPKPSQRRLAIDDAAAAVAATPPEIVERQLDVAFRGRAVHADVAESFGGPEAFDRWRRPMPAPVERVLREGGLGALAARAAEALAGCFAAGLAPEWEDVLAVLEDDISYRAERMAGEGTIALLDDLGDGVSWCDGEVRLERPFDVVVDWADDGLVLVPSTAHRRAVQLCAERPLTPLLSYQPVVRVHAGDGVVPPRRPPPGGSRPPAPPGAGGALRPHGGRRGPARRRRPRNRRVTRGMRPGNLQFVDSRV